MVVVASYLNAFFLIKGKSACHVIPLVLDCSRALYAIERREVLGSTRLQYGYRDEEGARRVYMAGCVERGTARVERPSPNCTRIAVLAPLSVGCY